MNCPSCGGTLRRYTFDPETLRCVGHYSDGRLVTGGCGHAERAEPTGVDELLLLCMEHAVMVEALRELALVTEPEPWEGASEAHELASRTLSLIEDGFTARV